MRASVAEDELAAEAELAADEGGVAAGADEDFASPDDGRALPVADSDALAAFEPLVELACEDACAAPWLAEDDPPVPFGENKPSANAAIRPTTTTPTTIPTMSAGLVERFCA